MADKIILVVASPRSGTTTVNGFFDENFSNVHARQEPAPWSRLLYMLSTLVIEGYVNKEWLEKITRIIKAKRIQKFDIEYYIETSAMNYFVAPIVKKQCGNVKIVHLIRDPRDVVTSYLNWVHGRWQSRLAHKFIPFWNVSGHRAGDMTKNEWNGLNEFGRYCWYWRFKNEKVMELCADDTANFYTIKFEDLISVSRKQHLQELLNFIGLSYPADAEMYFDTKLNYSVISYVPKWHEWSNEQCIVLNNICGDLMKGYGYGNEKEWHEKIQH